MATSLIVLERGDDEELISAPAAPAALGQSLDGSLTWASCWIPHRTLHAPLANEVRQNQPLVDVLEEYVEIAVT